MSTSIKISSKDNANIKEISLLQKSSKKRREEGVFVLEGLRLCLDALENGFIPKKAFYSTTALNKYIDIAEKLSEAEEIFEVTDEVFAKISDTVNPQGILCTFQLPETNKHTISETGKYIALDNIQDPSNLGAISRSAEAFGIDGLILEKCCDPFSSKSVRASMGALLRIPVINTDDMFNLFEQYNLVAYASVVDENAKKINEITFEQGSVVIIGNEANGVSENAINKSKDIFTIPMNGNAESLNAAVAASIIIWEMCK